MMLSIMLDTILTGLLIATLVFCLRLNRRLDAIRGAQGELKDLMASFDTATERARTAVAELKAAADEAAKSLKERSEKARALADELSIISDAGSRLADRLDQGLSARKAMEQRADQQSNMDRELLQTLRRVK